MSEYLQALRFLNTELTRFAEMDIGAIRSLRPEDALSTIPHHKRGSMRCGVEALRRLQKACDIAISQAGLTGRLSTATVKKYLVEAIVETYMRQRQELTMSSADRTFFSALKKASSHLRSTTHFIPCVLSSDKEPNEFKIGSIKFEKQEKCMERLSSLLGAYRAELQESDKDYLLEDTLKYYKDFNWVAEITIHNADPEASRIKAIAAVEAATNFLHMLIGARPSKHIKIGERHNNRYKTGRFEISDGKICDVSVTLTFGKGYQLGNNWWKELDEIGGNWALPIIGTVIDQLISGSPAPLAQRLLDAAHWYADATQERFPAAQIVKFVTAMERLVITNKERDLTKNFCRRTSALVSFPDRSKIFERKRKLARIYNARSRFVHGSSSPFDTRYIAALNEVEEFSRGALWCALNYFGQDKKVIDHAITDKRLDAGFEKLLDWAEERTVAS